MSILKHPSRVDFPVTDVIDDHGEHASHDKPTFSQQFTQSNTNGVGASHQAYAGTRNCATESQHPTAMIFQKGIPALIFTNAPATGFFGGFSFYSAYGS